MTNYRRVRVAGASYFFTVNCALRQGNALLTEHVDALRQVVRKVKNDHLKHGWVQRVKDWPHSSFHVFVKQGRCPLDWAGSEDGIEDVGEMF